MMMVVLLSYGLSRHVSQQRTTAVESSRATERVHNLGNLQGILCSGLRESTLRGWSTEEVESLKSFLKN